MRGYLRFFPLIAALAVAACNGAGQSSTPTGGAPHQAGRPPIGVPHADGSTSSLLPGASGGDLVYVLEAPRETDGEIFAYPGGEYVGFFAFPQPHFVSYGICSDNNGNVFATLSGVSSYFFIDEFAHSGTAPIATLVSPFWPIACSADPSTGDLAVVDYPYVEYGASIAIYRHARGTPHLYKDPSFQVYESCSYDDRGNLFVVGVPYGGSNAALAELPKGKRSFINISLNEKLGEPRSIEWDGTNLAIEARRLVKGQPKRYVVYRVQVSGSKAKIVGSARFKLWLNPGRSTIAQGTFVGVYGVGDKSIAYWHYPTGGYPYKVFKHVALTRLGNLTISRAPR